MKKKLLNFNKCVMQHTTVLPNLVNIKLLGDHLRLRDTRARAVRNVLGNVYLSSLTKNLWYEQREQLDSGGGGTLSQGVGHDGSFYRYAV